jgi:hypothetical protein
MVFDDVTARRTPMNDKDKDKDKPADKRDAEAPDEKSKGQYGGMDGLGPGGGEGFEDVKRPARPDDDRLPDRDG